jgi:hypothetical protein
MQIIPSTQSAVQTLYDLINGIYSYQYQIDGVNKQGGKITLLK